jgi:hypothetical protein
MVVRLRGCITIKLKKRFLLIAAFSLVLSSIPEGVSAERVIGVGAMGAGNNHNRTYSFEDDTITPPLALSWYKNESGAKLDQGFSLTDYRMHYGKGNMIIGRNDQTGMDDVTPDDLYEIGNPFNASWPSQYGNVSTIVELYTVAQNGTYSTRAFFGTSTGRLGRLSGLKYDSVQGEHQILFSPELDGGNPVKAIGWPDNSVRALAATDKRINMIETLGMSRLWYWNNPNNGRFSGITALNNAEQAFVAVTDNGTGTSHGFIWTDKSYENGVVAPDYTITYHSGIPKAPAYDVSSKRIYAVDELGRFYIHSASNGASAMTYGYSGDRDDKGYLSVGGVLLYGNYAFTSTLDSSQGSTKGTITRFIKGSTTNKEVYIHNAQITTTPAEIKGLIYFGDSNGKVWALNPNTMQLVNWYWDENTTAQVQSYDIGSAVRYVMGANNHLHVSSDTSVYSFKGRPDYSIEAQNLNGVAANGARVNFTSSTIPSVDLESKIGNRGTFDYNIYTDFAGIATQYTDFSIKNIDSGRTMTINSGSVTNNAPSNYEASVRDMQIPVNGSYSLFYDFQPPEEGEYEFTTVADSKGHQKEFPKYANTKTSTFDVVDMRKPTATSDKTTYRPGETVKFTIGKTQKYSYSSFDFQVKYPDGTSAMFINNQVSFPLNLTFSNLNQRGQYSYRIAINNRYGDTIYGDWKNFNVINSPPVADFNFDKPLYYIGDTAQITDASYDIDNDPLTYKYTITAPNGNVVTKTTKNYTYYFDQLGDYKIHLEVRDPYGATDTITKIVKVYDLNIIGAVTHTTEWQTIHQKKGNLPNQFYSGEDLILAANITNYPANYVKATLDGKLVNGNMYSRTTTLIKKSGISYTGLFAGQDFIEKYPLRKGFVPIEFEVQYINGQVRKHKVNIEIIDNALNVYSLHRLY